MRNNGWKSTIRLADYSRISNVLRKRRMQLDITGSSGSLSNASVYTISLKVTNHSGYSFLLLQRNRSQLIQSRPNWLA